MKIRILLAGALVFSACTAKTFDELACAMAGHDVPFKKPAEINDLDKWIVLDAREFSEYRVSHIAGARFVGHENFDIQQLRDIPDTAQILVYCSLGQRSEKVARTMQEEGFEHVYNLWGGLFNWVNEGHAVYNDRGPTDRIHPYNERWGQSIKRGTKSYE